MTAGNKVKVVVRVKPTNNFATENIDIHPDGKHVVIRNKKMVAGPINNQVSDWSFPMDRVLANVSQEQLYDECVSGIVSSALEGYNGTVMAYGQTGAGKTFTITGSTENFTERGMIPRALSQLYRQIQDMTEHSVTVRVSYMQIYNDSISDLLSGSEDVITATTNPTSLTVTEEGGAARVKGLQVKLAPSEEEALNLLFEGETNRAIAEHSLNLVSSRSHCIFTVYIEVLTAPANIVCVCRSLTLSSSKYTSSKVNFVDLAGSERLGKTMSEGVTKIEAMHINKSLTFLEQAIIALADKKREHVPFRQCRLTHVLRDSLGGNCNTVMIANVWGERTQLEETVSTLRFGTRMMCVANEPVQNIEYDPVLLLKEYEMEIKALKMELAMHDTIVNRSHVVYEPYTEVQQFELQQSIRRFISGSLPEIDIINLRQVKEIFKQFKSIVINQEKDIEARILQKYNIDLTTEGSKTSRRNSETDTGVGDTDGTGFGLGVAPNSAKLDRAAVVESKKAQRSRRNKERADSPRKSAQASPLPGPAPVAEPEDVPPPVTPALSSIPPLHPPSSPPSKADGFEEFKRERGSEINRIFIENKKVLCEKKRSAKQLADEINRTKVQLDTIRSRLEKKREIRLAEEGDLAENLYDEEEFGYLSELKSLKKTYKSKYRELQNLQSDIAYCQRLVEQSRSKLVGEFEAWYQESFAQMGDQTRPSTTTAPLTAMVPSPVPLTIEDNQEKFERLKSELLMENPESIPYQNAKKRMERKAMYRHRMPGGIKATVRNAPPSHMKAY